MLGLELPDDDRFYDDKADVLELNGLAEASSFLLRADREPPEALLGFLRLLNLSGAPPQWLVCRGAGGGLPAKDRHRRHHGAEIQSAW